MRYHSEVGYCDGAESATIYTANPFRLSKQLYIWMEWVHTRNDEKIIKRKALQLCLKERALWGEPQQEGSA